MYECREMGKSEYSCGSVRPSVDVPSTRKGGATVAVVGQRNPPLHWVRFLLSQRVVRTRFDLHSLLSGGDGPPFKPFYLSTMTFVTG